MQHTDTLIYLDNNSTTQIDPRVLEEMMPYLTYNYGNASSSHQFGLDTNKAVKEARNNIANLIGAEPSEIIFTSGATESINLAIKGFALSNQHKGKHIITVETEHHAVLATCKYLETLGFEISYLPVNGDGLIDLEFLKTKLRKDTLLVSVMFVNNETGVIQPIKEIADISHSAGAVFFSDATQAVGKIAVNVDELVVDLLAFSGHKFYAPKGIGGLYVKRLNHNRKMIEPLLHGGEQEFGLRSGTYNVPGIIAIGHASKIAIEEMDLKAKEIYALRNELERKLLKFPKSFVNGPKKSRIFNVTNICFPGIDANVIIGKMKNVAVSNGSACSSAIIEPSHVLTAMGLLKDEALASIRFSLGRFNTQREIQNLIKIIGEVI